MEKRGILAAMIPMFIGFASAQFFGYGGYGGFSITNFINTLDPATVVYGLLFFVFFTLLFLVFTRLKLFKGQRRSPWEPQQTNTAAAGVISFAISALMVYYLYRSGYNLQYFFDSLGFSGSLGSVLLVVIMVFVAAVIIIKFKIPGFLMVSGLFLILVSIFTNLIYEKGLALIIGFGLIVIGIFVGKKTKEWWGRNMRAAYAG